MTLKTQATVSPEEIQRRIEEYRRVAFEHRAAAVMVYPPSQHLCPWADCETSIGGIAFHLDQLGAPSQLETWLTAWWQGPGLVGRCPGCGRYVLFGYEEKKAVADPDAFQESLLPERWFEKAHIAPPALK